MLWANSLKAVWTFPARNHAAGCQYTAHSALVFTILAGLREEKYFSTESNTHFVFGIVFVFCSTILSRFFLRDMKTQCIAPNLIWRNEMDLQSWKGMVFLYRPEPLWK